MDPLIYEWGLPQDRDPEEEGGDKPSPSPAKAPRQYATYSREMQWEHEVIYSDYDDEQTPALNREGEQGWELVSVIFHPDNDQYAYYFKRRK